MPMAADDIAGLIREAIPDAVVEITDLAGDGDHYAAKVTSESFRGLTTPPLITGNEKGIEFTLTAPNAGTVQAGAPIIYKGVAVGLIDRPVLSADGRIISARAFVRVLAEKKARR